MHSLAPEELHRLKVRTLLPSEVGRAVSLQVMAFSSDPTIRALWPEPSAYLRYFADMVLAFGGGAFAHGSAHVLDPFLGAALWLPPGVLPDGPALEQLMRETVAEPQRSQFLAVLEQMDACHPQETHWHLALLGVDPPHQHRGIGDVLLNQTLARIDEEHVVAYLESSNLANVPFYRHHGFEVIREIRVGDFPPMIPMVRAPR